MPTTSFRSANSTQRLQAGMVANEGDVDALRLASLENRHALGHLVLVAIDLDRDELSLGLYVLSSPEDAHQRQKSERRS